MQLGADKIEPPAIRRTGDGHGWGHYRLKITGKTAGYAVIELICGDKREVIRVSVS